jgi:hypothetical protein
MGNEIIDWIQGDKFKGLANWLYSPIVRSNEDYDGLPNTFRIKEIHDGDIIYTHTAYARQLFSLLDLTIRKVVVITHNSDVNIDATYECPSNVIRWYSQNVNVVDPDICSLPIGLENNRWFPELQKKEKMKALMTSWKIQKNLLYVNHNITTNPKERIKPYMLFKGKSWITLEKGTNGKGFDSYLQEIYSHAFVLCPQGNGIDTHRFWECLYMGSIPVVKKCINNTFYSDLPICEVHDWEEIDETFLSHELHRIQNTEYDLSKLTFSYWANKIRNHE